jgi:hypothetical protein
VGDKGAFSAPAAATTTSSVLGEVVGMKDESLDSSFITSSIFILLDDGCKDEVLWYYNRERDE